MAQEHVVYVLTGPLYEKEMPRLPQADEEHRVPSGYWKIIVIEEQASTLETATFIFPQDTPRKADVMDYLTTINAVEDRTGLDVLWELPDGVEAEVERGLNEGWARERFD